MIGCPSNSRTLEFNSNSEDRSGTQLISMASPASRSAKASIPHTSFADSAK